MISHALVSDLPAQEYHLQQAIKASQVVKQDKQIKDAYIPTPPTISSDIQYDVLYPTGWQQPATYIRSSATVEDCNPISYCMDEEDELALKLINQKLPGLSPMSEDQFEEVMTFFEETVAIEQPFAGVHNAPIMSLEELMQHVIDSTPDAVGTYSKVVYDHWAARRIAKQNSALPPQLKFESGQESDDADPYVTFRRREIRQTRKTRHRDMQSADKLRKLRNELEMARNMLLMVKQREVARKDVLEMDKQVFEQRQAFRELKRKLKQTGDDELLITQKKPKLPPVVPPEQVIPQHISSAAGRPTGPELKTIEEIRADKQRAIDNEIQLNIEKHIRWNDAYVDKTMFPLTKAIESSLRDPGYLPAIPATYLPTPPASVSEDEADKPGEDGDVDMRDASESSTPFRYASPDEDDQRAPMPAFRRRVGRGGRLLIDRRMPFRPRREKEDDRFRYDHSDDDSDDDIVSNSYYEQATRRANERCKQLARSTDAQAANARKAMIEQANAGHAPAQPQAPTPTSTSVVGGGSS